jgi:hypothetical protein
MKLLIDKMHFDEIPLYPYVNIRNRLYAQMKC